MQKYQNAFVPLRDVNEYLPNGVKIRVRCSNKSPIKGYGLLDDNKVFVCTLFDDSGEIRMTFFKECTEMFFNSIQVGKVVILQHFQVKPADGRFDLLKLGVELNATIKTTITETQYIENIPELKYNLTDISTILKTKKVGKLVDVIAICKAIRVQKKSAFLRDETKGKIHLVLADENLPEIEKYEKKNPVVLLRNAVVTIINNHKVLSCHSLVSYLYINPDLPQTKTLKDMYLVEEDSFIPTQIDLPHFKNLKDAVSHVKQLSNKDLDKGIQFTTRIKVAAINEEQVMYKACPNLNCRKKLYEIGDGEMLCGKCNTEIQGYVWKSELQILMKDETANQWATCLTEAAEQFVGKSEADYTLLFNSDPLSFFEMIDSKVGQEFIATWIYVIPQIHDDIETGFRIVKLKPILRND